MNPQSLVALSITLGIISLVLAVWAAWNTRSLNRLRRTFFAGRSGSDLEVVLQSLADNLKSTRQEQLVLQQNLARLYDELGFAVQKVGLVRFNPFAEGGGNFSFTLALLDGHNSGVVLTSLHGREQNRIYSKNITQGKSESQLTEEEQRAISIANSKLEYRNSKQI